MSQELFIFTIAYIIVTMANCFMLWHNAKLLRRCEEENRVALAHYNATKTVIRRALSNET